MNQPQNKLSPDESAAALAFATHLGEGLMPKQQPQPQQDPSLAPEPAPGQQQPPQDQSQEELKVKMTDLEAKIDVIRQDLSLLLKQDTQETNSGSNNA